MVLLASASCASVLFLLSFSSLKSARATKPLPICSLTALSISSVYPSPRMGFSHSSAIFCSFRLVGGYSVSRCPFYPASPGTAAPVLLSAGQAVKQFKNALKTPVTGALKGIVKGTHGWVPLYHIYIGAIFEARVAKLPRSHPLDDGTDNQHAPAC